MLVIGSCTVCRQPSSSARVRCVCEWYSNIYIYIYDSGIRYSNWHYGGGTMHEPCLNAINNGHCICNAKFICLCNDDDMCWTLHCRFCGRVTMLTMIISITIPPASSCSFHYCVWPCDGGAFVQLYQFILQFMAVRMLVGSRSSNDPCSCCL